MGTPNAPYLSPPLQHACPSDDGTPALYGHFCLDTEVSVEGRYYCKWNTNVLLYIKKFDNKIDVLCIIAVTQPSGRCRNI